MRSAAPGDAGNVAAMLLARCRWLEQRGLPTWRDSVEDIAGQTANVPGAMWLLEAANGRVLGCTTVLESAPPWGWTPQEFAEPSHYLYTTATDPAFRAFRPGALIAWWAVDRAAREGFSWVRRGCLFEELGHYYKEQGFDLVHEVQRTRHRVLLFARRAEPVAGLREMFVRPAAVAEELTGTRQPPGAGR